MTNSNSKEVNNYYLYCYYDTKGPFYIGLGKGLRITNHLRKSVRKRRNTLFYNKLNKLINEKEYFYYKKLRQNLSLKEAKICEEVLIACIGRRDLNKGPLCNLTDGGEGHKGFKKSEELKKQISKWSKGKKLSKEHIERIREFNTGKKHSEETKRKLSEIQKGVSKPKRKESIPNYRKAATLRSKDPEYIEKLKEAARDRFGYKVTQLSLKDDIIKEWDNQIDAAKHVGGDGYRILKICRDKKGTHKGFKWMFSKDK